MYGLFTLVIIAAFLQVQGHTKTKCETERENAPPMPGRFTPQCEKDGSYSEVQCHGSTGYCWCVNENGEKLLGSEKRFGRPDCSKVKTKCQNERDAARPKDGVPVAGRYIPQCEDDGSYSTTQCHASTAFCWCVDANGQKLAGTEVRFKQPNCRRVVKTKCQNERDAARPKDGVPVVGRYIPQCEDDGSYSTTQCHGSTGYCWCVNANGEKLAGTEVRFKQPKCGHDCKQKRNAALKQLSLGLMGIFVPKCELDGSYKRIQCFGKLNVCWCVQKENGVAIKYTHKVMVNSIPPKCELSRCEIHKKKAQELKKKRLLGVFEPECQDNGNYEKMQCHENTCFCVEEKTGSKVGKPVERRNKDSLDC